jgi:uroporphyrinogen decarboxylase
MMIAEPQQWNQLMELLSTVVIQYLSAQIRSGADAVQIFDSWVGNLSSDAYRLYLLPHMSRIFTELKLLGAPVIHFGTGNPLLLPIQREAGGDVIGVDFRISLTQAAKMIPGVPLQGNLDPAVLFSTPEVVERETRRILAEGRNLTGHIFNLGHGILPETPIENVQRLVETAREGVLA